MIIISEAFVEVLLNAERVFSFWKAGNDKIVPVGRFNSKFSTKTKHSLFTIVKYSKTDGKRFIMKMLSFCHTRFVVFLRQLHSFETLFFYFLINFFLTGLKFFFKIESFIRLNALGAISNQLWSFYINNQRHVSNSPTSVSCDKSQKSLNGKRLRFPIAKTSLIFLQPNRCLLKQVDSIFY